MTSLQEQWETTLIKRFKTVGAFCHLYSIKTSDFKKWLRGEIQKKSIENAVESALLVHNNHPIEEEEENPPPKSFWDYIFTIDKGRRPGDW